MRNNSRPRYLACLQMSLWHFSNWYVTFVQFYCASTKQVEIKFLSCQYILNEFSSANVWKNEKTTTWAWCKTMTSFYIRLGSRDGRKKTGRCRTVKRRHPINGKHSLCLSSFGISLVLKLNHRVRHVFYNFLETILWHFE